RGARPRNISLIYCVSTSTASSTTVANTGSGTVDYVPQWTSTTGLGNSPIAISSGNVGIGTSNPTSKLEVAGQIAGKSIKTRLFNAGGKSSGACTLSSANTIGVLDQFCDLAITLTLTDPATVQINYSITM